MISNRNKLTMGMKSARDKFDAGDFEGTITDYTEAIDRRLADKTKISLVDKNRLAEAYIGRGVAKSRLGRGGEANDDYDKAINLYSEVIETDPKNGKAWGYRGVAKVNRGRHEEAIADLDEAIEINSADKKLLSFAYNNRGAAKYGLGRHEEAIADYTKAIDLKPADKIRLADAYNDRSASKNEIGDYQGAIADCTKAIEINPKNAAAWNNRGSARNALGRYQDAFADCTEAIRLEPKNALAWSNRSSAKAYLEDFDGAIKDVEEALRFSPNDLMFLNNLTAIETRKALREATKQRVDETVKAEEFKEQSDEYKRREEEHRKSARCEMGSLEKVIYVLIAGLISLIALSVYSDILTIADVVSNPFGLLPWITLIIIITSPRVWKIRLLIADANKAELMRAEYEHLFIVERRMLVYFAKDDTNEGRKIRSDYIQTTMTNSPSDKLLALQNKASVPSPNPAQNVVETIRNKARGNLPS